jgi:hypothetical protein
MHLISSPVVIGICCSKSKDAIETDAIARPDSGRLGSPNSKPTGNHFSEQVTRTILVMIKKPLALRATPSKAQVYEVFNRLFQAWPEDTLRPGRGIRNLKPLTPENPNFDDRHTFYQSAAMKIILSNRQRSHVPPSLLCRLLIVCSTS